MLWYNAACLRRSYTSMIRSTILATPRLRGFKLKWRTFDHSLRLDRRKDG